MKRILSLDGGGIRGALCLGYLQRVEDLLKAKSTHPQQFKLSNYFDLIGGTSTGSIIAAALAIGMDVADIKEKYFKLGDKIFGKKYDWWNPMQTRKFLKAEFSYKPLEQELKDFFGDITLGSDKILTNLCVVTKRADTNSTWLFHNNPKGKFFDSDLGTNKDIPLWQIVRASTAAPTYFVPQVLNVGDNLTGAFVDGGVSMANNPALDLFKVATMAGFRYKWPLGADKLFLLSVGTGSAEHFAKITQIQKNWLLDWAKSVPDMLMADASWNNQTMLQWMSRSLTPKEIDLEVGDLAGETLTEKPLLTYARFNAQITIDYLNSLHVRSENGDLLKFNSADVDSLKEMSNSKNCKLLYSIGEAAAAKEVNIAFP